MSHQPKQASWMILNPNDSYRITMLQTLPSHLLAGSNQYETAKVIDKWHNKNHIGLFLASELVDTRSA
jgi:hypothetical protein